MFRGRKRGASRGWGIVAVLIVAGAVCVSPAWAATTTVPISTLTNTNLRTYTGGTSYPVAPTSLTVGGIDFALVPAGATANSLGIIQLLSTGATATIPVNVADVTTVYTLMNSAWGKAGANIGTLEFVGSGGATASFSLVEGTNIRDHFNDGFNNTATNVVSATFGNDRLDRQTFTLPSAFAGQTLTEIRFINNGSGTAGGTGQPFLAAITVQTGAASGGNVIPLPGAALLCALGSALAGWRFRRRRLA